MGSAEVELREAQSFVLKSNMAQTEARIAGSDGYSGGAQERGGEGAR